MRFRSYLFLLRKVNIKVPLTRLMLELARDNLKSVEEVKGDQVRQFLDREEADIPLRSFLSGSYYNNNFMVFALPNVYSEGLAVVEYSILKFKKKQPSYRQCCGAGAGRSRTFLLDLEPEPVKKLRLLAVAVWPMGTMVAN